MRSQVGKSKTGRSIQNLDRQVGITFLKGKVCTKLSMYRYDLVDITPNVS